MKNIILSVALLFAFIASEAKEPKKITLEKIWQEGTFSQNYVSGLRSMEDGEHYTVMETVEGVQVINKYSYEKDKPVGTLLSNTFKDDEGNPMRIENYEISKDGSKILLKTSSERIYRHSMRSAYYLFDKQNNSVKRIGKDKFQLAAFSPDGKYVSYVRDNNLYIFNVSTMKEKAVTVDGEKNSIINGAPDWVYEEEFALVKAYDWSGDSKTIAYYRFDESNVKEFSFPVYGTLYPQNYVYKYPKAGEENAKVTLALYDVENDKRSDVQIPANYEYIPRIEWIRNNKLAIQTMNRLQNEVILSLVDRNTGLAGFLHSERSDTYLEVQDVYFFETKDAFLWQSEESGFNHLYYYEYSAGPISDDGRTMVGERKTLMHGEDVLTDIIGVNEEKGFVYYQYADKYNPTDRFYRIALLDPTVELEHPIENLPLPPGMSRVEGTKGMKYMVVYNSTVARPQVVTVHNVEGHPIRTLEDNKALMDTLRDYNIRFKEYFKFQNRNGDELVGWMIKPAGFTPTKKYPVLMYVYGGPGSQTTTNTWGGSNDMWFQYLAQQGYIIVSVDNRGTGARSRDFRTCTYGQLGKLETEDQIDAAQYFAHLNYVDEKRIGIWGWSYGGYMSTLCLAKGAEIFKMAIAVAPVSNWRFYDSIYTERYMGLPSDNGDSYDDNSPINHVDKIKGNYLLVHGTADDNVHFQNTTELIDALVKNNVQFDLAIYPNKNHGIYGGNTRYHLFKKMTDFIFENL